MAFRREKLNDSGQKRKYFICKVIQLSHYKIMPTWYNRMLLLYISA